MFISELWYYITTDSGEYIAVCELFLMIKSNSNNQNISANFFNRHTEFSKVCSLSEDNKQKGLDWEYKVEKTIITEFQIELKHSACNISEPVGEVWVRFLGFRSRY